MHTYVCVYKRFNFRWHLFVLLLKTSTLIRSTYLQVYFKDEDNNKYVMCTTNATIVKWDWIASDGFGLKQIAHIDIIYMYTYLYTYVRGFLQFGVEIAKR